MRERAEMMQYLVERIGLDPRDAELRFVDDDLWVLRPGTRPGMEDEEAVSEYEIAARNLHNLVELFQPIHGTTWMVLADAAVRAEELGCRAERRLES